METLIKKIKDTINLSSEAEEYLFSVSKEKVIPKGSILIRAGQLVKKIYFVTDGCLRSYCTDQNGKEHILQFAVKNWWISDYIAIYNNETATLSVDSLSESTIIEFQTKALTEMYTRFPEFESFQRNNLEHHVVGLYKRVLNQLQLSAAERYDVFVEEYPNIEKFTRNYHIASYLGITQASLSRIRVKKAKK